MDSRQNVHQLADVPERILVVDSEEAVRESICSILAAAGYSCQQAGSGVEALSILAEDEGFALVLSELVLPDMDGTALLERTKERHTGMPVVLVTAVRDISVALSAIRNGAYDYLLKPVETRQLLNTVKRALENRRLKLENRAFQQSLEARLREATRSLARGQDFTLEEHTAEDSSVVPAAGSDFTGLPTTRRFCQDLNDAFRDATESVALVRANLDNFRNVNDTHGIEFGNKLLRDVAKALQTRCETFEPRRTAYRIGGNDFAVILAVANVQAAMEFAELLRSDIEKLGVTVSIGVAAAPEDGRDAEELFGQADRAKYGARREGGNRVRRSRPGE